MRSAKHIDFHVVPGDGVPIYRQIMGQVKDAVAGGHLSPGDRLPSQRELAQRLVVAPLTVKKAYDLLEQEGVLESRHGSGTFVSQGAVRDGDLVRERLSQTARQLATQAALAGLDEQDLIAVVKAAAEQLREERSESQRRTEAGDQERE
ncbi:MAG: GntR family transcriptional regulator [Pseudohongiellaceae bacterium]|jgi:GntR family transcriptional regulator